MYVVCFLLDLYNVRKGMNVQASGKVLLLQN